MSDYDDGFGFGCFMVAVGMAIVVSIVAPVVHIVNWESHHDTHVITVEDKDRVTNGDGGSESRIYTDQGVFAVGDDWIQGEWNSADTYAQLEPGGTYTIETVGFRNGFFSWFPNIIEVTEVSK